MPGYEVASSPFFYNVECPKHKNRMTELNNGLIGEKTWWCLFCERPYQLKPAVLKKGTYDQELIDEQINGTELK